MGSYIKTALSILTTSSKKHANRCIKNRTRTIPKMIAILETMRKEGVELADILSKTTTLYTSPSGSRHANGACALEQGKLNMQPILYSDLLNLKTCLLCRQDFFDQETKSWLQESNKVLVAVQNVKKAEREINQKTWRGFITYLDSIRKLKNTKVDETEIEKFKENKTVKLITKAQKLGKIITTDPDMVRRVQEPKQSRNIAYHKAPKTRNSQKEREFLLKKTETFEFSEETVMIFISNWAFSEKKGELYLAASNVENYINNKPKIVESNKTLAEACLLPYLPPLTKKANEVLYELWKNDNYATENLVRLAECSELSTKN